MLETGRFSNPIPRENPMIIGMLAAAVAARFLVPSLGVPPDACQLLTAAQISGALGNDPSPGKPMGPIVDEETGAKVSVCSRSVGNAMLSISVAEFASPAAANQALTTMANQEPEDAEVAKMTEQPGVGERALWGATSAGAIWIALKGKTLLNVTLAGEVGNGVQHREPLKRLATLALAKL
jgi:hypothetical protein